MGRMLAAAVSVGVIAAMSMGPAEAAKARKKTEKVEYLRAAGSEPPQAPVKQIRKKKAE